MSDLAGLASQAATTPTDKSWLPEAYRDKIDVGSIEDLAKGYLAGKEAKPFVKPGKDAKPEEITAYRKIIGVPEKKEDYANVFSKDGKLSVDKGYADFMADVAFEAGVDPETLSVIHNKLAQLGEVNKKFQEQESKRVQDECVASLKYKYGSDYEVNMKRAEDAVNKLGGAEAYAELKKFGALNSPKIVDLLVAIGKETGESDILKGKTNQAGNKVMTAREAIAARLDADKKK